LYWTARFGTHTYCILVRISTRVSCNLTFSTTKYLQLVPFNSIRNTVRTVGPFNWS
jgi:hypothetical protein